MVQSSFTRAYNSFGGVDIQAVVGTKTIATLQGISCQVSREKAPVYTMGSSDPRAFARGKRAIAGSLVFIQFDSEPLISELTANGGFLFCADIDELRPEYDKSQPMPINSSSVGAAEGSNNFPGEIAQNQESSISVVGEDFRAATPWFADQIPPFDLVLTAANEMGALSIMKILGVELLNSSFGVSIDDIVCEHAYTYIAAGLIPWLSQGRHPDFI